MKLFQNLLTACIMLACITHLKAENKKHDLSKDQVEKILQMENADGFYESSGTGYLWAKVKTNGVRGVLICPEAGVGKAFIILKSGEVYERAAKIGDVRLSYCPTITLMNPKIWNEFTLDSHWLQRKRENLAKDFSTAIRQARENDHME